MTQQPDTAHISKADLRQLEASTEARFHAVSARFLTVDGRFAAHSKQLNDIGERLDALDRTTGARRKDVGRAIDQALAQLDQARANLTADIKRTHRNLRRLVVLGLAVAVLTTAALCLATFLLAL